MPKNEGLSSKDNEKTLYKTLSGCILRDMVTFSEERQMKTLT